MKDKLMKKSKSLKSAIDRYNKLKLLVDNYNSTRSLDDYIEFLMQSSSCANGTISEHHERMIYLYNNGNREPLLSDLYDKLLAADDYKNKLAEELKSILSEQWEYDLIM